MFRVFRSLQVLQHRVYYFSQAVATSVIVVSRLLCVENLCVDV